MNARTWIAVIVLPSAILSFLLAAPVARADNDQTVVIGIGAGSYSVAEDEVRPKGDKSQTLTHVYVEWYVLDEVGFGFRRSAMLNVLGFAALSLGTVDVLAVRTNMLTVNWIPYGAQDYLRIGLVAGVGNAKYEYDGVLLFGLAETHVETDGTATLGGIFVDWGGEGFGARFGFDAIGTDLDDVVVPGDPPKKADASGAAAYLDVRWAF